MLWLRLAIPAICGLAMQSGQGQLLMRYFWDTINECVPAATVEAELAAAGFSGVKSTTSLGVFREYASVQADPVSPYLCPARAPQPAESRVG